MAAKPTATPPIPPKANTPDILKPNVCNIIKPEVIIIDNLIIFAIASYVASSTSILLLRLLETIACWKFFERLLKNNAITNIIPALFKSIKKSPDILNNFRSLLNASSVKTIPSIQTKIVKGLYIEFIIQSSHILFVFLNCFLKLPRISLVVILIIIIIKIITKNFMIQWSKLFYYLKLTQLRTRNSLRSEATIVWNS